MKLENVSSPELLFLVGMPRSGTKLLRDLLSSHPDVALFPHETHFIPYFQRQFHRFGDVSNRASFSLFFKEFSRTTFARRMFARGITFEESAWHAKLRSADFGEVMTALFRHYSEMTGSRVVGDKTPDYVTQIPLLSELFPTAKFVHIIRDPRDYVLSMRKAWGKNLIRSAQRWKDQVRKFMSDAELCRIHHLQVTYEELLAAPEDTLARVCSFLGVDFRAEMLTLQSSPENLGDTRGQTKIVQENTGKWQQQLTAEEIARIESIAGNTMTRLGYAVQSKAGDENLSRAHKTIYRLADGLNLFRFRMREEGGFLPALTLTYKASLHSGVSE